jgi:phospholipid/cholesterol/gamma-HCH transport system substrate-binding protein
LVNGGLTNPRIPAYAVFGNCGQGLRVRGDVKLRGVLVGQIESIEKVTGGDCKVELGMFPEDQEDIPANVGAQVRAKTIFGEKWVELLYPNDPAGTPLARNDVIGTDRTIDPLEVETILNTALPLLDAVDPENLAATLGALKSGFVGHEEAAIRPSNR